MPYTIDYIEDKGIVRIVNIGSLSYEELLRESQDAIDLAAANHSWLFLVDCTRLIARATTAELYSLPGVYEEFSASRSSKLAVLLSEHDDTNENLLFYEKVCRNRGWQVKAFQDADDAFTWLLDH